MRVKLKLWLVAFAIVSLGVLVFAVPDKTKNPITSIDLEEVNRLKDSTDAEMLREMDDRLFADKQKSLEVVLTKREAIQTVKYMQQSIVSDTLYELNFYSMVSDIYEALYYRDLDAKDIGTTYSELDLFQKRRKKYIKSITATVVYSIATNTSTGSSFITPVGPPQ